MDYSTKHISTGLLDEILHAVQSVNQYGSVEIYVQNYTVSQITVRTIKKTNVSPNVNTKIPPKKIQGTISITAHANSLQ